MKVFLRKLFGIYPGEGRKTLRFATLVVSWSLGSTCLSTITDGLFIEKLGSASLPNVYLIAAISMISGSSLILWLLKTFSPYKILIGVLSIGVLTTAIFAIAICYSPPIWFWFLIKIFSLTFLANLIACSWALIDNYHDLQDAKRTYAMYNASYFLGVVISGFLISNFLEVVGIRALFFVSSICLTSSIYLVKKIVKLDQAIYDETVEGVFSGDRKGLIYLIKQIFSHPFVFSLLSLSLIIQLIGTTTEYSYLSSIGKFLKDSDGKTITKYLGNARAIISVFNIIIGVFFYNRIVGYIGLRNIILLPAFAFFILFGSWMGSDSLTLAIFGIIALDGISYTIEDNNYNQLVNAVPSKLKARVRIINDSFFEPLGMLISSALLLCANSFFIGFVLSIIMIAFSFAIRAIYHKYVFINLKKNAVHFEKKPFQWLQAKTKDVKQKNIRALIKGLNSYESKVSLLSIEGLIILNRKTHFEQILKRADKFQVNEKLKFLNLIEESDFLNYHQLNEKLRLWIGNCYDKKLINKCLMLLIQSDSYQNFQKTDLYSFDILKKATSIIKVLKNDSQATSLDELQRKAKLELLKLLNSFDIDKKILALEILNNLNSSFALEQSLEILSQINELVIQKKASKIIAKITNTSHVELVPKLLKILNNNKNNYVRINCIKALGNIQDLSSTLKIIELGLRFRPSERRCIEEILTSMGTCALTNLLSILKDPTLHDKSRILAAKVIARIDLKVLKKHFKNIVLIEIKRAYFFYFNAVNVQEYYPSSNLSVIVELLKTNFHSIIDFIIHLLAAVGSVEDCELLVRSLRSKNAKIHSHAVETLENACDRKIYKLIIPLVDNVPWSVFIDSFIFITGKEPQVHMPTVLDQLNKSFSISDIASFSDIISQQGATFNFSFEKVEPNVTKIQYEVAQL